MLSLFALPLSFVPSQTAPARVHAGSRAAAAAGVRMMPIGVPKVAYRVPGSSQADWVSIFDRLNRERILFLGQEINHEI